MTINQADITPAIKELQRIWGELVQEISKREGSGFHKVSIVSIPMPMISIAPRHRRAEYGWFKPASWKSDTSAALQKMSGQQAIDLDEVYISGEALALDPREIVDTTLHQLAHQVAYHRFEKRNNQQSKTYHNSWFASLYRTLGAYVSTDGKFGKTGIEWGIYTNGKDFDRFLNRLTQSLDLNAFDSFRLADPPMIKKGSGRMKLWHCPTCKPPPKLRTGAVLDATCNTCGSTIVYADKDRTEPQIQAWLAKYSIPALP